MLSNVSGNTRVDNLLGSFYWCNALCINQNDDQEKGHQVNQMGQIYSEAQKVLVWLGVADSETELAFQVINDVGHSGELLRSMDDDDPRDTGPQEKSDTQSSPGGAQPSCHDVKDNEQWNV